MFGKIKLSKSILIAFLLVFTIFAAEMLPIHQIVSAQVNPIPGVGIVVKKNPGGGAAISVRTDKDGKFTVSKLEPGNYTVSLKLDDITGGKNKIDFSKFKTAVITIEGGKAGKIEKRLPITELQKGITFDIEITKRSAMTISGICLATDEAVKK